MCGAANKFNIYTFGQILFEFGKAGTFVAAEVIVADISDLEWRGLCSWGLNSSLVLWAWFRPWFREDVDGLHLQLGWYVLFIALRAINNIFVRRVSTHIYAISTIIISSIVCVTLFVFLGRLTPNEPSRLFYCSICSFNGAWQSFIRFTTRLDLLGVFLWSVSVCLLLISWTMPHQWDIMHLRVVFSFIALFFAMFFFCWEFCLNNMLSFSIEKAVSKAKRIGYPEGDRESILELDPPLTEEEITQADAAAERTAVRLEEQKDRKFISIEYVKACHPLLTKTLVQNMRVWLACYLIATQSYSIAIGSGFVQDEMDLGPDFFPVIGFPGYGLGIVREFFMTS